MIRTTSRISCIIDKLRREEGTLVYWVCEEVHLSLCARMVERIWHPYSSWLWRAESAQSHRDWSGGPWSCALCSSGQCRALFLEQTGGKHWGSACMPSAWGQRKDIQQLDFCAGVTKLDQLVNQFFILFVHWHTMQTHKKVQQLVEVTYMPHCSAITPTHTYSELYALA